MLKSLKNKCLDCKNCNLCETRHNVLFGVGNEKTDIMFIGEGPGEQEDLKGEPFVGRAGMLLDKLLNSIHLDRHENIYIANIVKCRPPQNRDPKPEEQDMCITWLYEQIRIIEPKIIVCLGRIAAAKMIDPDIKIMRDHGKIYRKDGLIMMPILHPAAILRNQHLLPETFGDFLRLRDELEKISG